MPQNLHLSRQHQADYDLISKLYVSFLKTKTLTDDEKVVVGIIARRMPAGDLKVQALALYNHLMSQAA